MIRNNLDNASPIDVSQFRGRIFIIAGSNDQMWPSWMAAEAVRKQRKNRPDDFIYVFPGAGHFTDPQRPLTKQEGEMLYLIADRESDLGTAVKNDQAVFTVDGGHPVLNALYDLMHTKVLVPFLLHRD